MVSDTMIQSTSLVVMWELLSSIETFSTFTISYSNTNNTQCFNDTDLITIDDSTARQYALMDLQEATEYSITVSVVLNGVESRDSLIATTHAAGLCFAKMSIMTEIVVPIFFSLPEKLFY